MRQFMVLVCAVVAAGCEPPGNPHVADIVSPTGAYTLRLTGRVTKPYGFFSFEEHRLRAAVYKGSVSYVPARQIYLADTMDTAFEDRYGSPDWLAPTILRFPAAWAEATGVRDRITVQNRTDQRLPSVRIDTARDLFVLFDVAAGDELELQSTATVRAGDINWFNVIVERGGEAAPPYEHACFSLTGGSKAEYNFVIAASGRGVDFAERAGSSHRCK
jgi:hypothetical protein